MRGNFEEARQLYRRSRATLEEFGWNLLRGAAPRSTPAPSSCWPGIRVAAEGELRRDFETLDAMGERNYIATTAAYLAFALLLQGKYDEADRFVTFSEETAAPDDLTSQFLWRQFRARLLSIRRQARRRDRDGARAVELTDETEETESQGNSRLDLAHVYARPGDRRRRRRSARRRNASDAKGSACWSRTFSDGSTRSVPDDDLAAHPGAVPVRERGMDRAAELERPGSRNAGPRRPPSPGPG